MFGGDKVSLNCYKATACTSVLRKHAFNAGITDALAATLPSRVARPGRGGQTHRLACMYLGALEWA